MHEPPRAWHDARPMPRDQLSLAQARRIALAAQGFADPKPAGKPTGWAVRRLLDRGAHYAPRRLFEYWGHEASLIPVGLQPLLRWRMERAHEDAWGGMRRVQRDRPQLVAAVLEEVRERGPVAAS